MGNIPTAFSPKKKWLKAKNEDGTLAALMYPSNFVHDMMFQFEIVLLTRSWEHIEKDTAPPYLEYRKDNMECATTCKEWFGQVLVDRLCDCHPITKTRLQQLPKLLGGIPKVISFILANITDEKKVRSKVIETCRPYLGTRVKTSEFGIMGDSFFWTLETVLGAVCYPEVLIAWKKLYSMIIDILIPISVTMELKFYHVQCGNGDDEVSSKATSLRQVNIVSMRQASRRTMTKAGKLTDANYF